MFNLGKQHSQYTGGDCKTSQGSLEEQGAAKMTCRNVSCLNVWLESFNLSAELTVKFLSVSGRAQETRYTMSL